MLCWGKLLPLGNGVSTFELTTDLVTIGRVQDCDITIVDKRLSSKHCQIEKRDDGIFLKDLSTNGTFVNNAKIGKNQDI